MWWTTTNRAASPRMPSSPTSRPRVTGSVVAAPVGGAPVVGSTIRIVSTGAAADDDVRYTRRVVKLRLVGERVVLRAIEAADVPRLVAIRRTPEVAAWWGDEPVADLAAEFGNQVGAA